MDKKYQVMPPLSDREYKSLKEDIKKDGVLIPIIYDENGDVIDGYHRTQICGELGIDDWPSITKTDLNETDKRSLARKLNSARRQLNQKQKQGLIKDQLKDTPEWSNRRIADMLGVSPHTVIKYRENLESRMQIAHAENLQDTQGRKQPKKKSKTIINPTNESRKYTEELCKKSEDEDVEQELDKISQGKETSSQAKKNIDKKEKKEERKKEREEKLKNNTDEFEISNDKVEIHNGDFRDICKNFEDNSIDHIITDPPYPIEYLHLWESLSKIASRVLKPGGFCITYSGKYHLPKVIEKLNKHLEYYWQFILIHKGKPAGVYPRKINTQYKPILIFVKKPVKPQDEFITDVITGSGREKDLHKWQQSEGEMKEILDKFTNPNDKILDPMAGSGTTIRSCYKNNRRCIGIEKDIDSYLTIRERMNNV